MRQCQTGDPAGWEDGHGNPAITEPVTIRSGMNLPMMKKKGFYTLWFQSPHFFFEHATPSWFILSYYGE